MAFDVKDLQPDRGQAHTAPAPRSAGIPAYRLRSARAISVRSRRLTGRRRRRRSGRRSRAESLFPWRRLRSRDQSRPSAAPRRSARRRALPARPLGKPVNRPSASTGIWANSLRSNSASSPPPGICRMLERLASKALLGEPFGKVAADRMLRGFAAKEDITVAASRLRATVDRRPGSRVDHQSSRADIPWPLRPIAERRRARRNGLAAKSVRVTAPGIPTNGRGDVLIPH
jgi:hypothetical protein